jgi:hypothetical protein
MELACEAVTAAVIILLLMSSRCCKVAGMTVAGHTRTFEHVTLPLC